jgi:adenine-specific DNA-methyltransferase
MINKEPVQKETAAIVPEQMDQLRYLFPQAFTEGKIDFDKLKESLGEEVDSRPERYSFSWAGKRDAIRLLQTPSRATLVPAKKESINFDETNNIFIEGDNLEVLKLLYKSYFGRVKMIYIDPPYNTGNDFIYPDNFTDPLDTYLKLTGQKTAEGNLLTSNPETSGRYHSAWLSMMYPRLFVARQLLGEDGVLFVSINDVEVSRLRLLLDEVFGEEEFIGTFIWKSRHNVDSRDKTGISSDHEYVVCYGRKIQGKSKDLEKYSNPDNDPRGPWMSDNMVGLATKEKRRNLHYDLVDPKTGINYGCPEKGWRYEPKVMNKKIAEGRILWPSSPDGRPRHKKFLNELKSLFTGFSTLLDVSTTSVGTQEVRDLFGADVFEFPKPLDLIKTFIRQGASEDDIVMDFFAGSGVSAHAVLDINREDDKNRRFIIVQLPEPTGNKDYPTIAEIGKERIRRAIAKLKKDKDGKLDLKDGDKTEDLGFKVFKLAESNYKPWTGPENKDPEAYAAQMAAFTDPFVPAWKPENVVWEVAIKEGYGLNSEIIRMTGITENAVYHVTDPDKEQSFRICLDEELKPAAIRALALGKNDLFICRDRAMTDELVANLALQCRLKTI